MVDIERKKRLRPIAREKAMWHSEELRKAANENRNVGQVSLDLQDEMEVFVKSLDEEDQDVFLFLFSEELNVLTAQTNAEADALFIKNANDSYTISVIISVLIFIVMLAIVFF